MKNNIKRFILSIICVCLLVTIDQITKAWAVRRLCGKAPIPVIDGVLEFNYLENGNTGAAFGILKGHQLLFLIIAVLLCAFLFFMIYNLPDDKHFLYMRLIFTFIIAGGIGNMIDRIRLKYVVDFIYIRIINFPVFNVADMYVSVSTVLLLLLFMFYYKEADLKVLEGIVKNKLLKKDKAQ